MKTLNEQVNEILESKLGRQTKVNTLISLGLMPHEANFLVKGTYKGTRTVRRVSFKYTFGVEIECNVNSREVSSDKVEFRREGYNHVTKNYYKFVSDASVTGENAIECVSPVLRGNKNGFDSLKACCDALNAKNAKVNKSCGLHVHIATSGMTDEWYINIFENYRKLEKVIDSFMALSRRGNNNVYCRSLRDHNFYYCYTIEDIRRELGSRYHKVNAESWHRHHTIEFRQHQGTTDFNKISNWVEFCAKLVAFSKDTRIDNEVENIQAIPFLSEAEKNYFENRKNSLTL